MKKLIIFMILFTIVFAGCQSKIIVSNESDMHEDSIETPITDNKEEIADISTQETQDNGIGGSDRNVEAIGNINSFEDFEKLSDEEMAQLDSFGIEKCYFKPINEPKNMVIEHMTLSEVGFFLTYVNKESEEVYSLIWWSDKKTEEYLEDLKEILTRNTKNTIREVIIRNGIDYYCNFRTVVKEPSDKTEIDMPYHAEIRWIEDNKCMYMFVDSLTPIDDSIINYCQFEKYSLD